MNPERQAMDQDTGPTAPAPPGGAPPPDPAPREAPRHPAPGITHEPEPDAENLIPIEDGPGTL
ncbi:MAG: hypothetical protein KY464_18690 [Gemmatimonadetes bacterium]|nr:hypothetical protein [Gemmatimonadota bacterium]